jgi:hypothetical protein
MVESGWLADLRQHLGLDFFGVVRHRRGFFLRRGGLFDLFHYFLGLAGGDEVLDRIIPGFCSVRLPLLLFLLALLVFLLLVLAPLRAFAVYAVGTWHGSFSDLRELLRQVIFQQAA